MSKSAGPIRPVWLLTGPENGQKNAFVADLKRTIAARDGEPAEEHVFYGFEKKARDLTDLLKNGALFSTTRFVQLKEVQAVGAEEAKLLAAYCKAPADGAVLVMTTDELRGASAIESALPGDAKKIFWELYDNQKSGWIVHFFQERGIECPRETAELILEMVSNDTASLDAECRKFAAFFGSGTVLDPERVEDLLHHSRPESVFTLFEKIVVKDLAASLETLQALISSGDGEPIAVLGGLGWQFRKLLALKGLEAENYGAQEAYKRLKISSKRNQKTYSEGARAYSLAELQRILVLVEEYQIALRQFRSDRQTMLLELFLYYALERGGERARVPSS